MSIESHFPRIVRIKQEFARPVVLDVARATREAMDAFKDQIKPNTKVGITVGSRGIQNILVVLGEIIAVIKSQGASPVLLASMGSHGGGTEAGQLEVLTSLGITEKKLGAPVIPCATGREIGVTENGLHAYMLDSAFSVDSILVVNRVKTHTSFKGYVESGLAKMLVVGLGGPQGAGQFHSIGDSTQLSPLLVDVTKVILEKMPVIGGISIVENAYEETAKIVPTSSQKLLEDEGALLLYSKSLMPTLPVEHLDALVVEEMGKNFSGTGVDTNIVGRLRIQRQPEPELPIIRYISVLDLSEESHGNATGVGLVDFVTQKLVDKIDREKTYLNNLTTTFVTRAFIPMYFATEKLTLETMMFCLRNMPKEQIRLVMLPNTLFLTDCYVSEALLPELRDSSRFTILGLPEEIRFDAYGNLIQRLSAPQV